MTRPIWCRMVLIGAALLLWCTEAQADKISFTYSYTGSYSKTSNSPYSVATYENSDSGGANFKIVATSPQPDTFSPSSTGTFIATGSGTVSGTWGGVLSGTMTMAVNNGLGGTSFNFTGPVTIYGKSDFMFQTTGTFTLTGNTGTTSGTWTHISSGLVLKIPKTGGGGVLLLLSD